MLITEVTDANEAYFREVFGEHYRNRKNGETFLGLIDDEDNAVGAAAVEARGDTMMLSYIGIVEERRRQGLGSFFLNAISEHINQALFRSMEVVLFLEEEEQQEAVPAFLLKNGFQGKQIPGRRNRYDLSEILYHAAHATKKKRGNGVVVRAKDADPELFQLLEEIENKMDTKVGTYFRADRLASDANVYGGFYMVEKEIRAALCVVPCKEGVRVEHVYVSNLYVQGLFALFLQAAAYVAEEGEGLKYLYVDTYGDEMPKFEEKVMSYRDVRPSATYDAYLYRKILSR